ncbi:MAG: radical SAM protein [Deltaproteobacteria bacterium]|nr:radical SAM protein [Deltaproteobacteria bacterium]
MDVSLVLTHRCNLACTYCYAGAHHGGEMSEAVRRRAVQLMFADAPEVAQLGFFGGEPFLAFAAMREAAGQARRLAEQARCRLVLQATTNATVLGREHIEWIVGSGMRVCVSIDGVREAHDTARLYGGGKARSSFDAVVKGLRALVDAEAAPDAMMVVTPATVALLAQSVEWLWNEGVEQVQANLDFTAQWTAEARDELRAQLLEVGAELVSQRAAGREVRFTPLADAIGEAAPGRRLGKRPQVVVATRGDLYPCSPMVGEDRDDGPEAALRIGHVDQPFEDIVRRVFADGLHCSTKGECACASYLETGDMRRMGDMGAEWKRMRRDIGLVVGAMLRPEHEHEHEHQHQHEHQHRHEHQHEHQHERAAAAAGELRSIGVAPSRPRRTRALAGLMVGASALGFVAASTPSLLRIVKQKRGLAGAATAADTGCAAASELGGMSGMSRLGDADAQQGLTQVSQEDADAAALRARVAAKAAQQAAARKALPKPRVVRPDDEHRIMGGIGAHQVRDDDEKLLAELLKP